MLTLDLSVGRHWGHVEELRGAIEACASAAEVDAETAKRCALIVAELCENAIKYGAWDSGENHYRLHVSVAAERAEIRVESPLAEGAGVPSALRLELEHIERHPTPAQAFAAKVGKVANSKQPSGGLGLVRLAHEAGCELHAEVRDGWLAVIAVLPMSA